MAKINQLTRDISDWYISRGYITSRAFLTEQDLSAGTLHIAVLEGRLQAIRIEGAPSRQLKTAFPGLEGKLLHADAGLEALRIVVAGKIAAAPAADKPFIRQA